MLCQALSCVAPQRRDPDAMEGHIMLIATLTLVYRCPIVPQQKSVSKGLHGMMTAVVAVKSDLTHCTV